MADKRPAEDDKNGHDGNGVEPDVKKAKPVGNMISAYSTLQ